MLLYDVIYDSPISIAVAHLVVVAATICRVDLLTHNAWLSCGGGCAYIVGNSATLTKSLSLAGPLDLAQLCTTIHHQHHQDCDDPGLLLGQVVHLLVPSPISGAMCSRIGVEGMS